MSSALRFGKLIVQGGNLNGRLLLNCSKAAGTIANRQASQIRSIEHQDESFIRPPPFDYKNKRFTKVHRYFSFLDPTVYRMNANSRIVCVEGNMSSGKEKVAQELADRFGWLYMPEPKIDDLYVNFRGFDYRTLNKYIAEKLHAIDEKMYYENPQHAAVPWLKINFYRIKYAQYYDALTHLFNTGQGVVMERSPASDFVFAEAMFKNGYLPKDAYDWYFRNRYATIHYLLRPHLIVYLDCDPEISLKRIKERNVPHEVNSKVLTKKYLQDIEDAYKEKYLPDASKYSELLTYKWDKHQPLDDMVLDIENLTFDDWDVEAGKCKDWYFFWDSQWQNNRYTYCNSKGEFLANFNNVETYDVDSLEATDEEAEHRMNVYESMVPDYGINPELDSNVSIFKRLLSQPNHYKEEEYVCRAPFY